MQIVERVWRGAGLSSDDLPENVIELVAWLTAKLEEVPAEHRDAVALEISTDHDGYLEMTMFYMRPESIAEEASRVQRENDWKERSQADSLAQALKIVERAGLVVSKP